MDLIERIVEGDSYFTCHEATAREVDDVMCRGWWDNEEMLHSTNPGRIAARLSAIMDDGGPPTWRPDTPVTDEEYAALIAQAKIAARRGRL